MAQKRRSRRVQVQSSDQAVGTGVYAPSQVATRSKAAENAAAVTSILGVAGDVYGMKVEADLNKGYEEAAGMSEEELAALEGSRAYIRGATQKIAEGRAIKDAAALSEWYQTEYDKAGSLEDLDTAVRGWYEERYANLDPDLYKAVLPHMERSVSNVMGAHAKLQSAEVAADVENAVVTSTVQGLKDGAVTTAEDWQLVRSEAVALVGKERANDLLAGSLEEYVRSTGDYEALNAPWLEKIRTNPKYAQRLDKAQDDARKVADKAYLQATVVERAAIEADLLERAQQGDPSIMTDVRKQLEAGNIDESIVRTTVKAYANAVVEGQQQGVRTDAFYNGTTNTMDLSDSDYNDTAKAAFGELVETYGEAEGLSRFIDGVAKNGRMPTFMKRMLDHASPRNPEGFNQAYQAFSALRTADPVGYARLMTEETQMKFESYEVLLQDEGDPQRALNRLTEVRPELVKEIPREDYNDSLDDAIGEVADGPYFNNADELDPQLRRTVKKRYNHMLSLGYQPEQAAEFAVADIKNRYTIHNGVLWPNTAGANPDALDFQMEQSKRHDGDERDYQIVPAAGRPGYAFIRPVGGLAFGGDLVKVSEINARYEAAQRVRRDEAARQEQANVKQDIKDKAMARATGIYRTTSGRGMSAEELREERERKWNQMSPAEQNAVIREIEEEARRAKERAQQARSDRADAARNFEQPNGIL